MSIHVSVFTVAIPVNSTANSGNFLKMLRIKARTVEVDRIVLNV